MHTIKCVLKDMAHNVSEARDKIHKAHRMHDGNRTVADWQRDMAKTHLEFNTKINDAAAKMMADAATYHAGDHKALGMLEAYKEWHADIIEDAAEVMAMIAAYK